MTDEVDPSQHFDLPREQAAEVVVPLGLDLGLYRAADGSLSVPKVRLYRQIRELDEQTYRVWKAARAVTDVGRLLSVAELATITDLNPADVAGIVSRTQELMLVTEQTKDVQLLWMITNLRMLMINVGPPLEDGAMQVGLVDERFDLVVPQVFDVLARCGRAGSVAEAYVETAKANAAAGMTELIWTDPYGMLRVMWAMLPDLLANGVAWLDMADEMYSPAGPPS